MAQVGQDGDGPAGGAAEVGHEVNKGRFGEIGRLRSASERTRGSLGRLDIPLLSDLTHYLKVRLIVFS